MVCCIAFSVCLVVGTYIFWTVKFSSAEVEEADRFRSYMAIIPNVSIDDIESGIIWRHKQYDPVDEPTLEPGPGLDEGPEIHISLALTSNATINDCYSPLSKELNLYLYQLCQQYASDMYVGDIKLSPLLVLAEANLEGGRVDTSVTFSALASSSVFTFESVEDLARLNVTDCLRSERIWKIMSSEYYTRDRGALQCNPNYGANDPSYGPSESQLLADYVAEYGIPDYGTNRDSVGNVYTVADWIRFSRTKAGDRFNPESMVRIFADEKKRTEIPGILRAFPDVQNEWQVYCIMAYCHWCGSGYLTMNRDMPYAGFKTVARSDEYCVDLSQPAVIEKLYSICLQDIEHARSVGRNPVRCLDKVTGRAVFDELVEAGLLKEWDYYFRHLVGSNGWDQGATACSYPIGLLYGVIQMSLLYSGY